MTPSKKKRMEKNKMENKKIEIHITYDNDLTLKELLEILNLFNLSINDCYRERGLNNFQIRKCATLVNTVKEGSIWVELGLPVLEFVGEIVKDIAPEMIAACFMYRCNKKKESNEKSSLFSSFNINININIINLNISNKDKKD